MVADLIERLAAWMKDIIGGNMTFTAIAILVILIGLLVLVVSRLLRSLLFWLLIAGIIAFCWQMGLLDQWWQLLKNLLPWA